MKNVIIFAGGVLVGASGMYLYLNNKKNKEKKEEIAALTRHLEKKYQKKEQEKTEEKFEEKEEPSESDIMMQNYILNAEKYIQPFEKECIAETGDDFDCEEDNDDDEIYDDPGNDISKSAPYLISEHTFSYECLNYDKVELKQWKNGIITDDGDVVDNPIDILGKDRFDFKHNADEYGCIYVRNDKIATDYVINEANTDYGNPRF